MPRSAKKSFKKKLSLATLESWLKRALWVSAAFLVLVIVGTTFFFISYFQGGASKVLIEIDGPEKVFRGVPFEVSVKVTNDSGNLLGDVELLVGPGSKIVSLNNSSESGILNDPLGDMGSGTLTRRSYRFLATGEVDAEEKIEFKLVYFAAGGNRFELNKVHKAKVDRLALKIEVKKPEQVLPSSVFEFTIDYKNISDFNFPELTLEAQYPAAFKFVSASLTPDSLNNYWRLGELRAASSGNLEIRGSLAASDVPLIFPLVFSVSFDGKSYPIIEENLEFAVAPPPVRLGLFVNRQSNYIARIGDILTYTIQYENLSGIALADVVIKTELSSELFDFATLATPARVNLATRTLLWDASNMPVLRLLDAGGSGEVSFSIKLKDQFPIIRLNDKNFTLRLNTEIKSPSVPYYLKTDETKVTAVFETKVSGQVILDAKAFYRDAASGIVNNGPMPPKVGSPTEYSLHWVIRNYATDLKDVTIRAGLASGVRWTGIVKSNIDSVPLYNEATQEIIWTIDKIRATKGVLDAPLEAVFQVEATPNPADFGKFQTLLGETILRATDEFTNLELSASDVAITTSLPDDITIGQGGGRVGQ